MLRFSQMKAITLKKLVADFMAATSCCCTSSDLCGVTSESAFFNLHQRCRVLHVRAESCSTLLPTLVILVAGNGIGNLSDEVVQSVELVAESNGDRTRLERRTTSQGPATSRGKNTITEIVRGYCVKKGMLDTFKRVGAELIQPGASGRPVSQRGAISFAPFHSLTLPG